MEVKMPKNRVNKSTRNKIYKIALELYLKICKEEHPNVGLCYVLYWAVIKYYKLEHKLTYYKEYPTFINTVIGNPIFNSFKILGSYRDATPYIVYKEVYEQKPNISKENQIKLKGYWFEPNTKEGVERRIEILENAIRLTE